MKKIFVTMLLAVTLIFIGSQAEASEVYVGTYSDGTAVYLIRESVNITNNRHGLTFTCRVRAGGDYLNYRFYPLGSGYDSKMYYENSEGYSGYVFDGSSPVAAAIYRVVGG